MKKLETKIVLITLPLMLVALATLTWVIFGKNLNETIALIVVLTCIISVLVIFFIWQNKSDRLGVIKIIELESKQKVKNKTIRNIINICSLALMAGVFYFIFYSPINNYYVFVYVAVHITLSTTFLTPKKIVINNNAIHCFPSWKVKWDELKAYQLKRNKGILSLEKVDGHTIQVKGIKEEDIEGIETMIKKYNHETTN